MIRAFRISFRTNWMVPEEVGRDVWAEKMFDGGYGHQVLAKMQSRSWWLSWRCIQEQNRTATILDGLMKPRSVSSNLTRALDRV
jgi:hypothetical protein